jgi:predicted enzyme related to lactoylglutathione lyase
MKPTRLFAAAILSFFLGACSTADAPLAPGIPLSPEPLVGKFVWHDLITDDPAATRRFYGELFGWTFEDTERPGGGPYTLVKSGSRYLAGFLQLPDPVNGTEYSRWLGYLSVADVDDAVGHTLAAGGSTLRKPRQVGQVGRAAVIRDPQGAVVGLLRSDRGDPDDSAQAIHGRILWNELLAGDDTAAAEFYRVLAGYEVSRASRRGGTYYTLSVGERERAGILQNPMPDTPSIWLTHFAVTDAAAATDKAAALGATVLLAPTAELRDGRMALIADPTGAILALTQFD